MAIRYLKLKESKNGKKLRVTMLKETYGLLDAFVRKQLNIEDDRQFSERELQEALRGEYEYTPKKFKKEEKSSNLEDHKPRIPKIIDVSGDDEEDSPIPEDLDYDKEEIVLEEDDPGADIDIPEEEDFEVITEQGEKEERPKQKKNEKGMVRTRSSELVENKSASGVIQKMAKLYGWEYPDEKKKKNRNDGDEPLRKPAIVDFEDDDIPL